MKLAALGEYSVSRGGSVDPSRFKDETFDLYSIPAYDSHQPDVLLGAEIGSSKKVVQTGDVLLSRIVPHIRRVWVVGSKNNRRQIASGEWIIYRGDEFDPNYLRHFLLSDPFHQQFMSTVSGVGGSLLRARPSEVAKIKIPLPPLPEQRRIAAILDKADAIRRKRQQAIHLTEEFVRSVFLDMFGDPVLNPKGFDRQPLGEFASIIVDCPHSTPHYAENKTTFPCIRSSDLQDGNLVINKNTKYVDEEGYSERVKRLVPEAGDIIYCREGARLGNSGIVPKGVTPCLGQRTMLFRVDSNRAASEFLLLLLNNAGIKKQIQNMVIGAAAPRVNIKDLKNFEVIMPPANLQKVFSEIYGNFVRTKSNQNDFLDKGGSLFNSLVQRAFRGEL